MADYFDDEEIEKRAAWHRAMARDLFVALVSREGPACNPHAFVLAEIACELANEFEDVYDGTTVDEEFARERDQVRKKYLSELFGADAC